MTIDIEQFHQVFFEESLENIDMIEQSLIGVNDECELDAETINTIFRAAHSIKGGSGTFGFMEVTDFTHLMETLLDEIRDGVRKFTYELVEVLLKSCDCLRVWFDCLQEKKPIDTSIAIPLSKIYESMLNDQKALSSEGQNSPIENLAKETVSQSEIAKEQQWRINFIPQPHILINGNEPLRIFRQLEKMGKYSVKVDDSKLPEFDLLIPDECYLSWTLTLTTEVDKEEIIEVFEWVEDDCILEVEEISECELINETKNNNNPGKAVSESEQIVNLTKADKDASSNKQDGNIKEPVKNKSVSSANSSIRVGIDKVDNLINLVGELVITQAMLSELGSNFDMSKIDRLSNGLEQLLQNTKELQENVMRIRMLPISFSFNRFPRMIHDLSLKIGKKVDLVIQGEQTELDKTVMEKIGDPLVHLVRNAVDHGIEPVEERIENNKPEKGTIKLHAYHKGGSIVIEISDDGRGLDANTIAKKAIEKGLISDTVGMTETQIFELIFEPGFSTAQEVSDISGRGVGMDVVRKNIKSLGGRIDIESTIGKGSTFKVHLPLTLAILDGQLIKVGNEVYIIPLVSIVESIQMKKDYVKKVSGNMNMYSLREDNVPIVSISQEFNLNELCDKNFENSMLVVVEGDGSKVGLLVDDLLSQQQVVIKSLETNYKQVKGISGATILGDGSVALIIDISGLISLAADHSEKNSRMVA